MFGDVGNENFLVKVSLPTDEDGLLGRECPDTECHPRYFKVRPESTGRDPYSGEWLLAAWHVHACARAGCPERELRAGQ